MTFENAVLKWFCQFDRDDESFFLRKKDDVGLLGAGRTFWRKTSVVLLKSKKNSQSLVLKRRPLEEESGRLSCSCSLLSRCLSCDFVGIQERADPDWANTSIKPFQHTSRRKKALTLGRRKEKFRQRNWGSNPVPLALRTSALTTELSRHSRELR